MNWEQLWAAVTFSAEGGRYERFLQAAAEQGVHLRQIRPAASGFFAGCPARKYRQLVPLARRYRVRVRLVKRHGLYFSLRGLLRRTGFLAGLLLGGLLIWQLQHLVWAVDCTGMTTGQAARTKQALRSVGIQPGAAITQELLSAGENALLAMDEEFSWVSVNFEKGRLTVEAAAAKPVPEIDSEEILPLLAKVDGTVTAIELEDGTPLVAAGQQVVKGQILIDVSRAERDGSLNYRRAAGVVLAQVEWAGQARTELTPVADALTGKSLEWYELSAAGRTVALGKPEQLPQNALLRQRHTQLSVFGLPLPVTVVVHTAFLRQTQQMQFSEELARAKARLLCQQQLFAEFPDAEILRWQEQEVWEDGVLHLEARAVIQADIGSRAG